MSPQTSPQTITPGAPPPANSWKQWVSLDNRYVAPVFITCILLTGHL